MLGMKNDLLPLATWLVTVETDFISQEGGLYCRNIPYWTVAILKGNIDSFVSIAVPVEIVTAWPGNSIPVVFILNFYFLFQHSWHNSYISYISFKCTIRRFNIFIPYHVITSLIQVIICHHANLSQYYWLYFPSPFHSLLTSCLLVIMPLVSTSMSLFLFGLVFILDSIYKWNHTVFIFLCLTYSTYGNTSWPTMDSN